MLNSGTALTHARFCLVRVEKGKKINFLIGTWLGHGLDVVKIRTPTKLRKGETKKKKKKKINYLDGQDFSPN